MLAMRQVLTPYRGLIAVLLAVVVTLSYLRSALVTNSYKHPMQTHLLNRLIHFQVESQVELSESTTPSLLDELAPRAKIILNKKTELSSIDLNKTERYLTIYPLDGSAGRLGNFCFRYAAGLGIAKANGMTLVLPDTPLVREMRKNFKILARLETEIQPAPGNFINVSEEHWGMFDKNHFLLPKETNVRLTWVYSQSWKYFYPIEDEVKKELAFNNSIQESSISFLRELRELYKPDYLISMHVRRGDFLSASHQKWGYAVAPEEFFANATKYYIDKYGPNILFIVASDDKWWCQHTINFNGARAKFSSSSSPLLDMAVMAACDHHIVSVGSFGWWSAWLGKGDVVYYKGFPTPGSPHSTNHNPVDYYPQNWISF